MAVLIETDILIALVRKRDRHHKEALTLFEEQGEELLLSPYSIIELDALIWSNALRVKDKQEFFALLSETLNYYNVKTIYPSPLHVCKAYQLRSNYGLTFFGSLHAATAIIERLTLISYDRSYGRVKELNYLHTSEYLSAKGS